MLDELLILNLGLCYYSIMISIHSDFSFLFTIDANFLYLFFSLFLQIRKNDYFEQMSYVLNEILKCFTPSTDIGLDVRAKTPG